jgi:hemoglobin/transferrin/lactoferrin receptor protein
LNDGIRLQGIYIHSAIADNSFFNFPVTRFNQRNFAFTGNVGLIYSPYQNTRVTLGLSSGFRAPNIDDLARIFESNTASRQLIIPNPNIKPEYTYNADLGLSQAIGEKVRLEVSGFYTWFRNAIALAPFTLNGQDSVMYNGSMSRVFANQNVNKAIVYGYNAALTIDLMIGMRINSTLNYTYGRLKPFDTNAIPLDHIPPVYGRTGMSYTQKRYMAEAYALYNGWKRKEDYHPSGEDNLQYATPEGTPSWITLNFKSSFQLHKLLSLQLGVENILDRNYRYFASGFSAPGRNWIIALRSSF